MSRRRGWGRVLRRWGGAAAVVWGISGETALSGPLAVLPPGFDFHYAIEAERESLAEFYEMCARSAAEFPGSAYGTALSEQMLGLVERDPARIAEAEKAYLRAEAVADDPRRKEACRLGAAYARHLLSGRIPTGTDLGAVDPVVMDRFPAPTNDFRRIIIGASAIRVPHGAILKTQVDRVTRDWLAAFRIRRSPWDVAAGPLAAWHEGMRVAELAAFTGGTVVPVWGTLARRRGDRWYAPDAEGRYRFEISPDKVFNVPTGILIDDHTVLIHETHGISAIAWDSLGADLVVGCGDHDGKVEAAYDLARRGVNVYLPTDRNLHRLIGVRAKGVILGSAPVRREGTGAVIGDRPMAIDPAETIVVSDGAPTYPLKYYDAPRRYFEALAAYAGRPLKIVPVQVREYGRAGVVVDEARRLGATLLGIRAKSSADHEAVAGWLRENKAHRAVLFHTAAYPDGYKLFAEFPDQTSFGDPRPRFE